MRAWRRLVLAALGLAGLAIWTGAPWSVRPVPVVPALPLPGAPPAPGPAERPVPRADPGPSARPVPRPPRPAPQITSPVERILIEKAARRMTVWQRDGGPRVFPIALGFAPVGDKARQGDGRTPEGAFRIDRRNPGSAFHLSLGLDYPRPQDHDRARREGVDPGGDIMIHGQPNQIAAGATVKGDWTAGCIAVSNPEIRELFAHTAIGTPVEIRP